MDSSQIKYPIYIVSKGRYKTPYTARIFIKFNIPFYIVIEPQEYNDYSNNIPKENILTLPFSNLGLGSFPARNWCWEDSISRGFSKHFLFDDNIISFKRLNNGFRIPKANPIEALLCLQELTHRYINVGISGFNYSYFVTKSTSKPFSINTHVYSGMLINNKLPYRWRMKYNEDVDLSLQVLHNKQCTILLNAFLIEKISTTVKLRGGNQDELYKGNDPRKKILKARSIERAWPQYAKTVWRFGRPHHQISWTKFFKHPLKKRDE